MKLWQTTLNERHRKFGRDVGSVVLGVLIALGIGEIAEAIRWEVRASTAETAIRTELSRDAGVFEERALLVNCLQRRLGELNAIVAAARRSGQLPRIGEIGRPSIRPIEHAAWGSTSGSETLLHIDAERRKGIGLIYAQMSGYSEEVLAEHEMWAALKVLENSPGRISDDLLADAAGTLARLSFISWANGVTASQLATYIKGQGIRPSYFIIFDREGRREEVLATTKQRPICQPLPVQPRSAP